MMTLISVYFNNIFIDIIYVPSVDEIGPVVVEKEMKMWKIYRQIETKHKTEIWAQCQLNKHHIIKNKYNILFNHIKVTKLINWNPA